MAEIPAFVCQARVFKKRDVDEMIPLLVYLYTRNISVLSSGVTWKTRKLMSRIYPVAFFLQKQIEVFVVGVRAG